VWFRISGAGLLVAFGCGCCHRVPAVSLAELFTAGMFVWKLLQQTLLDMCCGSLSYSIVLLLPLCEGGKAAAATVAVGRACSSEEEHINASSGTVNIHSVYHADVDMC
jgi:hypothetical protein